MNRLPVNTRKAFRGMTVEGLMALAEALASKNHDGHLLILRTTTCWIATFEVPAAFATRDGIELLPESKSLRDALIALVAADLEAQP